MFWQFVNHMFRSDQAQRLYPILGMFGSMGLICSGNFLVFFSRGANFSPSIIRFISSREDEIEITIKLIIFSVALSSLVAIFLFRNIYSQSSQDLSSKVLQSEKKASLGLWESMKLIYNSRYIFYIFLLVISYGLAINILEGPWKAKLSQLYTSPCDYIKFMGQFNIWMGFSSVIMTIIGGNILRLFGWTVSAYITPVMITLTGCLFFVFVIFGKKMQMGFDPIYIAVIIGAIQNILSKSSKYSLFDSTKEMSYIPLSVELKSKGKAAVEVIGAKFGKSLGAFLQFVAFTIVPDLDFDSISVFLMVIFLAISIIWLIDVGRLSKEYHRLNNAQGN
jgi:ATP/ADP translocase